MSSDSKKSRRFKIVYTASIRLPDGKEATRLDYERLAAAADVPLDAELFPDHLEDGENVLVARWTTRYKATPPCDNDDSVTDLKSDYDEDDHGHDNRPKIGFA